MVKIPKFCFGLDLKLTKKTVVYYDGTMKQSSGLSWKKCH